MFLSSSSKAIDSELDITDAVVGSGVDSGVPNAEMLIAFTESANRLDDNLLISERPSSRKSEKTAW